MVRLSIETIGTERFVRGFNRYVEDVKDFREPFAEIAEDFYNINARNFDRQGFPQRFAPLSPKYALWKRKHFPGRKIMELTGRLRKSLTAEGQADYQDTIRDIKKKEATLGSRVPYAHRHQMGTRGMPQRKVVQLTNDDKMRWGKIIQVYAHGKLLERLWETPAWRN